MRELKQIRKMLGVNENVDLKELDPMIEFEEIVKKKKLSKMSKDGSFVAGIECDLSLPLELVNKRCGDSEVIYEPEFGMLFKNRYMHKCFIRARDIHKCSLEKLYIFQAMYVHR